MCYDEPPTTWEDMMPEYLRNIDYELTREIEARVENRTKEYKNSIDDYNNLKQQKAEAERDFLVAKWELKQQIADLEEKLHTVENSNVRQSVSELLNGLDKVKTKYILSHETRSFSCPKCFGIKKITKTIDGEKYEKKCDICDGNGFIRSPVSVVYPIKSNVYKLVPHDDTVDIFLSNQEFYPTFYDIKDLYVNEEELRETAKQKNELVFKNKIDSLKKKGVDVDMEYFTSKI